MRIVPYNTPKLAILNYCFCLFDGLSVSSMRSNFMYASHLQCDLINQWMASFLHLNMRRLSLENCRITLERVSIQAWTRKDVLLNCKETNLKTKHAVRWRRTTHSKRDVIERLSGHFRRAEEVNTIDVSFVSL